MLFDCKPKILHRHCLQFLLGVKIAPRETENNAYAKFWGDKQRALWYVMVVSGVFNYVDSLVCVHSLMQILSVGLKITFPVILHKTQYVLQYIERLYFLIPCYFPRMSKSNITDLLKSGLLSK